MMLLRTQIKKYFRIEVTHRFGAPSQVLINLPPIYIKVAQIQRFLDLQDAFPQSVTAKVFPNRVDFARRFNILVYLQKLVKHIGSNDYYFTRT